MNNKKMQLSLLVTVTDGGGSKRTTAKQKILFVVFVLLGKDKEERKHCDTREQRHVFFFLRTPSTKVCVRDTLAADRNTD